MTKEQLGELFEEYSRFKHKAISTVEGTGLGLAITQSLINLMDGGIDVESEPGVGSMFAVKLPQRTVDNEVLGEEVVEKIKQFRMSYLARSRRAQITREYMPYGKVLIVDDVETNLYVATGLMKPYYLQIETVMSGYEAINKIKNGNVYDIIFMDHMMPDMDGIETTRHLRESGYKHTIVALTANAVVGQADIFMENGFNEFMSKPIDIRQLNSLLNKYVRDKQPPEVIEAARKEMEDMNVFIVDGHIMGIGNIKGHPGMDEVNLSRDKTGSILLSKRIDGLDIVKGLSRYEGDAGTYLEILRSYAGSIRSILEGIAIPDKEKLNDYKIKVHGIKGASFDIFAEQVGSFAKNLEDAAGSGDFDLIVKQNPSFMDITYKLISDLDELFAEIKESKDGDSKPVKDKPDAELLSKLSTACSVYNLNEAEAVMEEIESYKYGSDDGLVDWLRENVDTMNFTAIVEKVSDHL